MPTSVVRLAEPFFLKVLGLINQPASSGSSLSDLRTELTTDLKKIEDKIRDGGLSLRPGEWEAFRRILVYWADEVLTVHTSGEWQEYVLEYGFYRERNRAWKFYTEAETNIPAGNSELSEVVYLALVLGFEGDIEDAFRNHLSQPLPGGRSDPAEARRYWASLLQGRLRHEVSRDLQGEPLHGTNEPIDEGETLTTAFTVFLISLLCLLITVGWYWMNIRGKPSVERPQNTEESESSESEDFGLLNASEPRQLVINTAGFTKSVLL
jgi:type VI protein secretion system component VasF